MGFGRLVTEGKKLEVESLNRGCRREVKQDLGFVIITERFDMDLWVITTKNRFSGGAQG